MSTLKNKTCPHCGNDFDITVYDAFGGDGFLCRECGRIDVLGWMGDLEPEDMAKLEYRVRAQLPNLDGEWFEPAIDLILDGLIDYEDLM
jgi:endogenous inhibitor of DNA gyrase (YacG/DUF329 family)